MALSPAASPSLRIFRSSLQISIAASRHFGFGCGVSMQFKSDHCFMAGFKSWVSLDVH